MSTLRHSKPPGFMPHNYLCHDSPVSLELQQAKQFTTYVILLISLTRCRQLYSVYFVVVAVMDALGILPMRISLVLTIAVLINNHPKSDRTLVALGIDMFICTLIGDVISESASQEETTQKKRETRSRLPQPIKSFSWSRAKDTNGTIGASGASHVDDHPIEISIVRATPENNPPSPITASSQNVCRVIKYGPRLPPKPFLGPLDFCVSSSD
jgi:hypothetical protein